MRVFLLVLLAASVSAQTGSVSGTITDGETGQPLVGASVFLVGTQTGAATGLDGRYTIARVPLGTHTVRVAYVGYVQTDTRLRVAEGEPTTLDAALAISGDLTICFVCVPPTPLFPRGPFISRVVTYERVASECHIVEPGDTFTRDG